MALTLFVCIVLLMVLGVPVAFALAISSAVAIFVGGKYPQLVVFKEMFTGIDSFPLMAVPFFIFAAELMSGGALTHVLLRFAAQFVGHLRGGWAMPMWARPCCSRASPDRPWPMRPVLVR